VAMSTSVIASSRSNWERQDMEPIMPNDLVTTVVRSVRDVSQRVRAYELVQPEEWELPRFNAGSHIDVHIPGGYVRQYSLLGDPALRQSYFVAVSSTPLGTGGSAALLNSVGEGDWLSVSLPRNYFPLAVGAKRHVFIAGGIGITPFLSMIAELGRSGGAFELHMCSPSRADTPFLEELSYVRGTVSFYHSRDIGSRRLDVPTLIASLGADDHVYCCGPEKLMNAVRDASMVMGNAERFHFERFDKPVFGSPSYRIELLRRKLTIDVLAGETMLSALKRHKIDIDYGCEGGTCGRCRIRYVSGQIQHNDLVLSNDERRTTLISCICGVTSESVALDL
jgi:ferredoxin-NADP reductase